MGRRFLLLGLSVFVILADLLANLAGSQSASAVSPCLQQTYREADYVVCTVNLRVYLVRLFWKDPQQQPYAGFDHLPRRIEDGPIRLCYERGNVRTGPLSGWTVR